MADRQGRRGVEDPAPGRLIFASSNPHKVEEVRAILADVGLRVVGLDETTTPDGRPGASLPKPVEDGETFEENARIKAVHYAKLLGAPVLADDSGLVVDALGGEPGVRSARWAGVDGARAERDRANNEKLLAALQGVAMERRTARFVCAMCLAAPDGRALAESLGAVEGRIALAPRGQGGFGYDPLFELPCGTTTAELAPQEKNAVSHRANAARDMAVRIAQLRAQGALV